MNFKDIEGAMFLYYLVKSNLHGGIQYMYKKSQWIVFPWENTLNSKSDREEYIKKRGLN